MKDDLLVALFSTSMDVKLDSGTRLCLLGRAPNMPTLLEKGNAETFEGPCWISRGVVEAPKDCRGPLMPTTLAGANLSSVGKMADCLLHGVSGIWALGKPASGSSTLRFFFEMSPVDMKAAGKGLAAL